MQFKSTIELNQLTLEAVQGLQVGQYIKVHGKTCRYIGIKDNMVQILSKKIGSYTTLKKCRDFIKMTSNPPIQLLLW